MDVYSSEVDGVHEFQTISAQGKRKLGCLGCGVAATSKTSTTEAVFILLHTWRRTARELAAPLIEYLSR